MTAFPNVGVFADHLLPNFLERLKGKKIETDFTFQEYEMVDWMFRQHLLKLKGGKSLEWRMQRGHSGDAEKHRIFQPVTRNIDNRITNAKAYWGAVVKTAAWNQREADHFDDDTALIEYMDSPYIDCLKGTLDRLEQIPWEVPESAADDQPFHGLPFLFPMLDEGEIDPVGGFNGTTGVYADGDTTTEILTVNRTNVPLARTWAATHNGVNSAYLDTLRRAMKRTGFKAPRDMKGYVDTAMSEVRYFTNQADQEAYESLVNRGPDNRNGDANPFTEVLYRGMIWKGLAALDGKAHSPGYGWNFKKTFPFAHKKYWMRWSDSYREPGDDESYYKRLDCELQMVTINERSGGWCMHETR